MKLLSDALAGLGSAVLPLVAVLLFEELTLGGLVRLVIAPRPQTEEVKERNHRNGGLK